MTDLNEKALEAARKAHSDAMKRGVGFEYDDAALEDAIRALTSATPPDVAGLVEEARIDNLRLRAFQTNAEQDRQAYFDAASKWFQDRHFRRMEAATALRLSAGGGVPDGWKLVPVEPTFEMQIAGRDAIMDASDDDNLDLSTDDSDACYRAMLAASPTVEVGHVE